jgi:hypothetical protein
MPHASMVQRKVLRVAFLVSKYAICIIDSQLLSKSGREYTKPLDLWENSFILKGAGNFIQAGLENTYNYGV